MSEALLLTCSVTLAGHSVSPWWGREGIDRLVSWLVPALTLPLLGLWPPFFHTR